MPSKQTRAVALGGVLASVAVVVMCLGGFIPIATYVCPMICTMTQFIVLRFCGKRIAWTWFAVVCVLSLLLGPDKEAAIVFLAIGYYPLIKGFFDKCRLGFLLKLSYFNISVALAYSIMIYLMGMQEIVTDNMELGVIGLVVIIIMGNVTFLLLDRLLWIMARKLR